MIPPASDSAALFLDLLDLCPAYSVHPKDRGPLIETSRRSLVAAPFIHKEALPRWQISPRTGCFSSSGRSAAPRSPCGGVQARRVRDTSARRGKARATDRCHVHLLPTSLEGCFQHCCKGPTRSRPYRRSWQCSRRFCNRIYWKKRPTSSTRPPRLCCALSGPRRRSRSREERVDTGWVPCD